MIDVVMWQPTMQQCAPGVGVTTLSALMRVESSGNPYAILDNGPAHLPYSQRKKMLRSYSPRTKQEAIGIASDLISKGRLLDLGLMQINSRNVAHYKLTWDQVFDPCMNIKTGASILTENYKLASSKFGDGQKALRHALSMYNTGSLYAGQEYVNKIIRAAGIAERQSIISAPGVTQRSSSSYAQEKTGVAPGSAAHKAPATRYAAPQAPSGLNPYTAPAMVNWNTAPAQVASQ